MKGKNKPSPDRKMIKLLTFDDLFPSLRHFHLKPIVEAFPAKLTLVHACALRSIKKMSFSWSSSSRNIILHSWSCRKLSALNFYHLSQFLFYFYLKGSFSNDDGDGNEDVKKAMGLLRKTTTLHVHHAFLYISLPSLHDYDVKMPNCKFYGGSKQATRNLFFSL